jgi:hypothetical protein
MMLFPQKAKLKTKQEAQMKISPKGRKSRKRNPKKKPTRTGITVRIRN